MSGDRAETIAEFALWLEKRERYIAQSAATEPGKRAELPPRQLAPLVGNEFRV